MRDLAGIQRGTELEARGERWCRPVRARRPQLGEGPRALTRGLSHNRGGCRDRFGNLTSRFIEACTADVIRSASIARNELAATNRFTRFPAAQCGAGLRTAVGRG